MHTRTALALLASSTLASAHLSIQYPGSRGSGLTKNGTTDESSGLGVFIDQSSNEPIYPYGMQFNYPCGGIPTSANRTLYPISGTPPPLIYQPGLQGNHDWGMIWVNIGLGSNPVNFTTQMMHEFSFTFPTADVYTAQMCLPELRLPADIVSQVKAGDNATIQVIESAKHGGSLYSCIDITFTTSTQYPSPQIPDISTLNPPLTCTNDTQFQFGNVVYGVASSGGDPWSSGNGGGYDKNQSLALGLGLGLPLIAICCILGFFLWKARRQNRRYQNAGLAVGISAENGSRKA